MNNSNRNTRTLIVSFVLAIMVLIPLRFVEAGEVVNQESQVLGEQTENTEVILPVADVGAPLLEAPYNELDASVSSAPPEECISKEDVAAVVSNNRKQIESGDLDATVVEELVDQMVQAEAKVCK